jgi:hypothetical protein
MPMLVHVADARDASRIERAGLVPARWRAPERRGVYAMPVLPSYFVSHQWVRELKRRGMRTVVAVYFRVPDREPVVVGHYNAQHTAMSAARAARVIAKAADPRGYEVLLPRRIAAGEIHAIRPVSQLVGWRYYPGSHGRAVCGCPACLSKGQIRSRRLREAYEATMRSDVTPETA